MTTAIDPVMISEAYERLTRAPVADAKDMAVVATDATTMRAFVQRSLEKAMKHQCYPRYHCEDTTEEAENDLDVVGLVIDHLNALRADMRRNHHALMNAPLALEENGGSKDTNALSLLFLSEELVYLAELARVRYVQFRETIAQG